MKTCKIKLSQIALEESPPLRAAINREAVDDYAAALRRGAKFPPIVLFTEDSKTLLLADGLHRIKAAEKAGLKELEAEIRHGGYRDALKYGLLCNSAHGVRRTNRDKRRAVELVLKEWPELSNRQIAELAGVDDHTVSVVRAFLEKTRLIPLTTRRIGKRQRVHNIARKPSTASDDVDVLGNEIPEGVRVYWKRRVEVLGVINTLSKIRAALQVFGERGDKLWRGCVIEAACADLRNVIENVSGALPYAVCPVCKGLIGVTTSACLFCDDKGMVSKTKWELFNKQKKTGEQEGGAHENNSDSVNGR